MRKIRSEDLTEGQFVAAGLALSCQPGRAVVDSVEVANGAATEEDVVRPVEEEARVAGSIRTIGATSVVDEATMPGIAAGMDAEAAAAVDADVKDPAAEAHVPDRASCALVPEATVVADHAAVAVTRNVTGAPGPRLRRSAIGPQPMTGPSVAVTASHHGAPFRRHAPGAAQELLVLFPDRGQDRTDVMETRITTKRPSDSSFAGPANNKIDMTY